MQLQTFHKGGMAETDPRFLPVKSKHFTAPYRARAGFRVASLGGEGALIEIGAIAHVRS
ncbi:hypothetical protein [Kineococcus aurantiacus]|uniref:Uncharacterized protein n=1 Tax=Kineococcus aurantiacus TaxID=37633 RepID=A0A7Y9DQW9_9ACTN|nr:hypothetical protein [Kineococcus aurantiacus]NYD25144.1 hypothetical protein [Kineococcus aurantiacus]